MRPRGAENINSAQARRTGLARPAFPIVREIERAHGPGIGAGVAKRSSGSSGIRARVARGCLYWPAMPSRLGSHQGSRYWAPPRLRCWRCSGARAEGNCTSERD